MARLLWSCTGGPLVASSTLGGVSVRYYGGHPSASSERCVTSDSIEVFAVGERHQRPERPQKVLRLCDALRTAVRAIRTARNFKGNSGGRQEARRCIGTRRCFR